jgi:hypothetical protein
MVKLLPNNGQAHVSGVHLMTGNEVRQIISPTCFTCGKAILVIHKFTLYHCSCHAQRGVASFQPYAYLTMHVYKAYSTYSIPIPFYLVHVRIGCSTKR